ncbi:hypothetical protein B0H10DRAFT_2238259 [Mycena sp. CBHHK59/15]|nr:hypothetical protein B0H10DRAFT_2238259 [Mycena sp. CBHHK59/15]
MDRTPLDLDAEPAGLYDSVLEQLSKMPNALSNLEYIGTPRNPPDIFRGHDWSKNVVFTESTAKDAPSFRAAIIGEIAEPRYGTLVRAQGNHYDGRDGEPFKPVDDKSKVKDVLVLRAPTHCAMDMKNSYDNQTALLQDIENTENSFYTADGVDPNFKSCLRSARTDLDSKDLITLTTQKKYAVPAAAGAPKVVSTPKRVQRTKRKHGSEDDDISEEHVAATPPADDDAEGQVKIPADDDVQLGVFYDPRVLEDYGGLMFQHVNAKLLQLDIRDADNKLIPPWKQYAALRPGTLVLALVTIHIFTFKDNGSRGSGHWIVF